MGRRRIDILNDNACSFGTLAQSQMTLPVSIQSLVCSIMARDLAVGLSLLEDDEIIECEVLFFQTQGVAKHSVQIITPSDDEEKHSEECHDGVLGTIVM
jgi:hypothetical protein